MEVETRDNDKILTIKDGKNEIFVGAVDGDNFRLLFDTLKRMSAKRILGEKKVERWVLTKEVIDEMNELRKRLGFEEGDYREGQVLEVLIK